MELHPDKWTDEVTDPSALVVPPALCKKGGGAKFRIGCDDDGNYIPPKEDTSEDQALFGEFMAGIAEQAAAL